MPQHELELLDDSCEEEQRTLAYQDDQSSAKPYPSEGTSLVDDLPFDLESDVLLVLEEELAAQH